MGLFSNNIQYAGGFIEQEDGPVMIAMLDGTACISTCIWASKL